MENDTPNTPAEEVKPAEDVQPETTEQKNTEEKKSEPTIAETVGTKEKTGKPDTVPFEVFEREKKAKKELKDRIEALEEAQKEKDTKNTVLEDLNLDQLAEEYGADKNFLDRLVKNIEKNVSDKYDEKFKSIEQKENEKKREQVFEENYSQAISNLPDLEGIANKDVIKALAMMEQNQDKTYSQLIQEAYGNSVQGKPTMETSQPQGGKEPVTIDYDRVATDPEYFDKIMDNPALKEEYNKGLFERVAR